MDLVERFESRRATVGVVGLGYVGLPLAVAFAGAGFRTVGYDLDESRVAGVGRGESYLLDVPSERLAPLVGAGRLTAVAEFEGLAFADAVLVCVPTPLTTAGEPNLGAVEAAVRNLRGLDLQGRLLVLESTTYPGTTEEVVKPELEAAGLRAGSDFHLAFSPERTDPGNRRFGVANTPKVVGGVTPACTRVAAALYGQVAEEVVTVSSAAAAEMVKLLENSFRAVNIALANETALVCRRLGIDPWEVAEAAATKPFGYMPFYPGPGVGGHCIPVDPLYLRGRMRTLHYRTRCVELAHEINSAMPDYVVGRIAEALNPAAGDIRGARIMVLGVAYKADVDDARQSPALEILLRLRRRGAEVAYHDPHIPRLSLPLPNPEDNKGEGSDRGEGGDWELRSVPLTAAELRRCCCAVLAAGHAAIDRDLVLRNVPLVFDARNFFRGIEDAKIHRL